MENTTLSIRHEDKALLAFVSPSGDPPGTVMAIARYLEGVGAGHLKGILDLYTGPVGAAAPTTALAHVKLATCLAGTIIEVNGAPFTAIAGTAIAANDEFDIDGTDAADAADLSRAINASTHVKVSGVVKAVNPLKDILTAATAIAGTSFTVTLSDGTTHRFVGKTGAATAGVKDFSVDTGNTECATSIAAQVVGYAPFSGILTATSAAAVVTFRSVDGNIFTLLGTASVLAESGGAVVTVSARQRGTAGNGITVKTLSVVASGTVTAAGVDADDAFSVNGVATTGKQQRATGTLTAAAVAAADVCVISGVTFTAVAGAVTLGSTSFSKDTGNTETATSLAAQINAYVPLAGIATATSAAAVVTVRAVTSGTGGNAIVFTGTAVRLAASGSGTLAGAIAVANNEFDASPGSTNAQVAADIVRAVNASTTALINQHVRADADAAVVQLWAKYPGLTGNAITLTTTDATDLAVSGARFTGGTVVGDEGAQATGTVTLTSGSGALTIVINGVTAASETWASSDNATAALLNQDIQNSADPLVRGVVEASVATNVVTIKAVKGGVQGNSITLSVTGTGMVASVARLAAGAVPTSVVVSNNTLTSGASQMDGGAGGLATSATRISR